MGRTRLELHQKLVEAAGSSNVYFQPPETIKMQYPCIVYTRNTDNVRFADGTKFNRIRSYSVIVIDRNPESSIAETLSTWEYCHFDREYTTENLSHFAFTLYY